MRERPIIFSGEMVRAILDGRKTQTRRIVKLIDFGPSDTKGYDWQFRNNRLLWNDVSTELLIDKFCKYGKSGDRLWVKETFTIGDDPPNTEVYRADSYYQYSDIKWTPSIFMPRKCSRINLLIKDIRVERVQDITEEDAISEGVRSEEPIQTWTVLRKDGGTHQCFEEPEHDSDTAAIVKCEPTPPRTAKDKFEDLWNSINSKRGYGWDENPWIWVIEFKKV